MFGLQFQAEQKLQHVHNLFEGETKQHYREELQNVCQLYEDTKSLLITKYSNISIKNRILQYLQASTIDSIMKKDSCSTIEALEKL